ncbi:MAG TPA: hypothetical protein VJH21_00595 [Candidatus Paceibacterota bacterium]
MSKVVSKTDARGYRKQGTILERIKRSTKEKGLLHVIHTAAKVAFGLATNLALCYLIYKPFRSKRTFVFQEKSYHYFYHWYNTAWKNERTIEIPIVSDIVNTYRGKKILEVGNVLSHYVPVNHDILDKYEEEAGVINQDIVEFNPPQKYDLIVSISTLEHVGWDERPRDKENILKALKNLVFLLKYGGKLVVTFPLGYNPNLDSFLKNGEIKFTHLYCLKRSDKKNMWRESTYEEISDTQHGDPRHSLIVGIIEKQ